MDLDILDYLLTRTTKEEFDFIYKSEYRSDCILSYISGADFHWKLDLMLDYTWTPIRKPEYSENVSIYHARTVAEESVVVLNPCNYIKLVDGIMYSPDFEEYLFKMGDTWVELDMVDYMVTYIDEIEWI